jgi:hypothetical protein
LYEDYPEFAGQIQNFKKIIGTPNQPNQDENVHKKVCLVSEKENLNEGRKINS